jgi:DNA polymerase V
MTGKTTGFASPSQGYEEHNIDLNRLLVLNPPATYFFRLETGDLSNGSMGDDFGLVSGSLLIVDRSIAPASGALVLIRHEAQFLCRKMETDGKGNVRFTNGITAINPIPNDTEVIGVITASIKTYGAPIW